MFFLSLISWGLGYNIRDGWFFEAEAQKSFADVFAPAGCRLYFATILEPTPQKINDALELGEGETAWSCQGNEPNLEMFIHVAKRRILEPSGMPIFVIRDALFHLGTTIRIVNASLERWGGVLFSAELWKYIEFCKRENHKTLLDIVSPLSPEQFRSWPDERQTDKCWTVPWDPPNCEPKRPESTQLPMYAYKLNKKQMARLYKFLPLQNSRRIFVMSTNCVLLRDTIVGTEPIF